MPRSQKDIVKKLFAKWFKTLNNYYTVLETIIHKVEMWGFYQFCIIPYTMKELQRKAVIITDEVLDAPCVSAWPTRQLSLSAGSCDAASLIIQVVISFPRADHMELLLSVLYRKGSHFEGWGCNEKLSTSRIASKSVFTYCCNTCVLAMK